MSEHIEEDLPANEAELLLPFYVNGTLDEQDRQIVENWLNENAEAADHLARAAEELQLTRADAENRGVPPRRVLDSLMTRIGETPGGIRRESLVERIWVMLSPRYALAGAAAFALVIVAQASYIVYSQQQAPAQFQTATGRMEAFSGPTALVVFAPTADMGTVSSRLADLGLVIVDGPKPGGIFVVGGKDSDAGRAALAELGKIEDLTTFFQVR
jgi:anti-sigma-K factor RskA